MYAIEPEVARHRLIWVNLCSLRWSADLIRHGVSGDIDKTEVISTVQQRMKDLLSVEKLDEAKSAIFVRNRGAIVLCNECANASFQLCVVVPSRRLDLDDSLRALLNVKRRAFCCEIERLERRDRRERR